MKTIVATILSMTVAASAADWPQFLGPHRDGSTAATEKAISGDSEAETLWKRDLGSGFAGPVVVGGRVIVFHRVNDEMVTESLQKTDGSVMWKHRYTTDYVDGFGFDNGPRAVPAVVNGDVFTHGPEGRVEALDLANGELKWSFDTAAELGSPPGYFGRACSPLVMDGKVLLNVGGRDGAGIIALDAKSGKMLWKATDHEAGYAAGVSMPGDPSTAAFFTRNGISLLRVSDGKVLADEKFRARIDASVNAATPLPCGDGKLFFSAAYDVGGAIWQWNKEAQSFTNLWHKNDVLDSHYSTPVWHDGYFYGFHGRQESGTVLRCVSSEDGSVKWEGSERLPGGTLIRVHDKLLVVTESGELWVVSATPDKLDILSRTQILGSRHRSHAAFADGVLFARDGGKMVAVRVR